MKVIKYFIWFVFFITYTFSAQIKGVVLDENNKPIPFVNIWVENEEIGTTSDFDGSFVFPTLDKNLIFSAIGYETIIVKASESKKVNLRSLVYQLNEVIVTKPKKTEEIIVGTFNKKETSSSILCGNKPLIVAKYFSNTDEIDKHPYLKEIVFKSFSLKNNVRMILHFYDVNEDGNPGQELIDKNYFIFINKGSKINKINVEKMNLSFSDKGIFVGVEWLLIKENEFINKKNVIIHMPMLTVNRSQKETYWEKISGKWIKCEKLKTVDEDNSKEAYLDLAINLILTN